MAQRNGVRTVKGSARRIVFNVLPDPVLRLQGLQLERNVPVLPRCGTFCIFASENLVKSQTKP